FNLHTSEMFTTNASNSPTPVVNPAIITKKKNSRPKKVPAGIMSNKLGIVKNNKHEPESGATSSANRAGNITSPKVNDKQESSDKALIPSVTRLDSSRLR